MEELILQGQMRKPDDGGVLVLEGQKVEVSVVEGQMVEEQYVEGKKVE